MVWIQWSISRECRFMAPIDAKEELPDVRDADATMALYQRVKRTVKQGIDEAQVSTLDMLPWHSFSKTA